MKEITIAVIENLAEIIASSAGLITALTAYKAVTNKKDDKQPPKES
ncbi:hypothetical protein HYO62_07215 [Aerococcaceae bacterium DSM 111022]|nr:hypothetical protein [Aerococcaceae bacterium DSM 111022]